MIGVLEGEGFDGGVYPRGRGWPGDWVQSGWWQFGKLCEVAARRRRLFNLLSNIVDSYRRIVLPRLPAASGCER